MISIKTVSQVWEQLENEKTSPKNAIMASYISSSVGRVKLAQAMTSPLLTPQKSCSCCGEKWRSGPHPDNGCDMRDMWDVHES